MTGDLTRVRLMLLGAALLVFLGGMLVAIGRWNRAQTDRAFVETAALAARAPPAPSGMRYWAPVPNGAPEGTIQMRVEAAERLRQVPAPPLPAQVQPSSMPSRPGSAPLPGDKPPPVPR